MAKVGTVKVELIITGEDLRLDRERFEKYYDSEKYNDLPRDALSEALIRAMGCDEAWCDGDILYCEWRKLGVSLEFCPPKRLAEWIAKYEEGDNVKSARFILRLPSVLGGG